MDIDRWLEGIGLAEYAELFRSNNIDGELLRQLTGDDLKEIGVTSLGHRKRLLKAVAALSATLGAYASTRATPAKGLLPERRQLTVMFADLVGSTALSKQLDPEDMSELIRTYQNTIAGEISRLEGHIAQYIGDGVLAYFGWPRAHEDDAERAVRAGLAIIAATSLVKLPSAEVLQTRIGIATGVVVVGDLMDEGVTKRHAVVGDTPNLAARLQSIAQPGMVVIAEATRRLAGDLFVLRELGMQHLKGIPEPTPAFAVLAERSLESRFAAKHQGEVTPIIGREQELALLEERWSQAKSGEGQVVLLSGEAGIGKSRLAEAVIDAANREPHFLLRYQCSPHHTDSALYPVIQQLARAAGVTESDSTGRRLDRIDALLARATDDRGEATPLIAALLGIDASSRYRNLPLTPQERRKRTLAALIDQLIGLAGHKPVLWVVEDAHWIDPTTLELIELTLRRLQGLRVLALITSRLSFTAPFRDHPVVTMLALDRLNRAGTQAIVARVTRGKSLPDALLDKVVAATDGVPLFIEEITKGLLESGVLRETATSWQLEAPLAHLTIPTSLHDSLMARLDRLQSVVKEVAQTAAVIGRAFDYVTLAHLSLSPASELSDALGQLVEAELIFCQGEMPDLLYRFKHALVRDAAYESLLKTSRRSLHLRLLDILETGGSTAPEILAHHAHEGGDARKAVSYWQQAAEAASRRYAHREAAALYAMALEVAEELTPEARASMLEACAWENLVSDEVTVSVTRYEQALEIWKALGRGLDQGRVLSRLSRSYGFRCRGEESHRVCHDAVALLQAYPDSREYLEALCEVARVEMIAEHALVAIEAGSRALALAEQQGEERLITQLLNNIGMARFALGEIANGYALLERSLAIARKNRDQDAIGRFYMNMMCLLYIQRRYKECEQCSEECAKEFPVGEDAEVYYWMGTTWLAWGFFEQGRWDEAESHALRTLARQPLSGTLFFRPLALVLIARLKAIRGSANPDVELREATELATSSQIPTRIAPTAIARCEACWLAAEGLGEALIEIRSVYDRLKEIGRQRNLDELGYWLWCHGVEVEGVDPASARGLQIAGRWREAADVWHNLGCPLEEGQALLRGDEQAMAQARGIFERLGAAAYLAKVSGS